MTKTAIKEHGNRTHGMSRTKFYKSWDNMLGRCGRESAVNFDDYGGRGISVCERWQASFDNFYADMYESYRAHVTEHGDSNTSIDRMNNNLGYTPDNCQWATRSMQSRNRRKRVDSVSGFTGVYWYKPLNKWGAKLSDKHIGYFESKEAAVKTRQAYQAIHYGSVELNGSPYDLERLVSGFYAR